MTRIGLLILHIQLPGSDSLKAKRRRLKPLVARLQREFNISVAEVAQQDSWGEAVLACALVSNANGHAERSMQKVVEWVERHWPDVTLIGDSIEIIH